jgi:transmembrane sensor
MIKDRLVSLLFRKIAGNLSPDEARELEVWAEAAAENLRLLDEISDEEQLEQALDQYERIQPAEGFARWLNSRGGKLTSRIRYIAGWSVAASLLIAVSLGILTKNSRPTKQPAVSKLSITQLVLPGRNTAMLTLGNGQRILLDSAANGDLAIQGGTRLIKADSGSLSYRAATKGITVAETYNTLTTPRSGQYQLTLSDGSRVWLNNASSLRYPAAFTGKDRTVELTGEGYFEIAHKASQPFVVKVRGEAVEVLGTSFNIMAYLDEGNTQTTLLSGAVKVNAGGSAVLLKPDEQSQLETNGNLKVIHDVPSQDIVSWKNGFFYFGRASFEAVMRQLARWYDVDVIYEGKAPEMEFGGKIDRSLPLNELLKFLDKNQIHFRLEGRKLIVLPN